MELRLLEYFLAAVREENISRVAEAAASVGYSDPLYFSRRFSELTGKNLTGSRRKAVAA